MKTIWKGAITFGLVNIPIRLYTATEAHALGFTLLHAFCKTPLKYHRWCPHCEKEVAWDDTVKGLEVKKGSFVVLTQEMLTKLKPTKTETINIVEFIDTHVLEPIYLNHHYYVAPTKATDTAYALFTKALDKLDKVAIGRFVMRDKEYTCALRPYKNYILLTTLHYSYEIKELHLLEEKVATPAKVDTRELALAEELIKKLSVKKFNMDQFKDTFAQKIKQLLKTKPKKATRKSNRAENHVAQRLPHKKRPSLMDSLRASLEKRQPVARARAR